MPLSLVAGTERALDASIRDIGRDALRMFVWAAIVWAGLFGFYLLLAGDAGAVEIVASCVCASFGTALTIGLSRVGDRHFAELPPLGGIVRPMGALLPETLTVGREFTTAMLARRDRRGAFVHQPFEPGVDDDPQTAARRAAVILGISLAPRSFVVRGEALDTMLLHTLPAKAASPDRRWPT